jgi:hypothetical protein
LADTEHAGTGAVIFGPHWMATFERQHGPPTADLASRHATIRVAAVEKPGRGTRAAGNADAVVGTCHAGHPTADEPGSQATVRQSSDGGAGDSRAARRQYELADAGASDDPAGSRPNRDTAAVTRA